MVTALGAGFPSSTLRPDLQRYRTDAEVKSLSTRSSKPFALHVDRSASLNLNGVTEQSRKLTTVAERGPPRWFSPLECGSRSAGSPLLFFLPGIDGDGFGLKLQHKKLGEIFDIWCLHIPLVDRTPLKDLVVLVESSIRLENDRATSRPIYLVGESFGASLALVVAARNPDIDLVLILANPASTIQKSLLQNALPLWNVMMAGQYMSLMPGMTVDTILWKLRIIDEMQIFLNLNIHAVKAQTLILTSGKDILLSQMTEGDRVQRKLQRCDVRSFVGNEDPLFSDDTFDLVATLKRTSYYRRGASIDYVLDFLPSTPSEYKQIYEPFRWMDVALNPVMFSTMDSGKVVGGLAGIPSEGPVLLVGNHMLVGMDLVPLFSRFWLERNIMVRAMAHPGFFSRLKKGMLPDVSLFDWLRQYGGVPVTATNLYKLLSSKCHVLLYPGGVSEALHGKGEEYKLIWPTQPEFIRMAARFGAKIVPFGGVGEDDILQLVLDSKDQMKIPPLKAFNEQLTSEAVRLRNDAKGALGEQVLYYPVCVPKLPGRLYFAFGKPISTQGRRDLLQDKDKAQELYLEIQSEIQNCIAYLKVRRERDPYRNLLPRLAYMGFHGFDSHVPTFEI